MLDSRTETPRRAAIWLLIVLGAALFAYGYRLDTPPLLDDPNDAQYAEVAREMVETGEWISPQLDYVLFLNKPPLTYWLIASSYEVFGINEFAARVPNALTALILLLIVWRLGRALWDGDSGRTAAFVALGTAGLLLEARQVRPDLLLTTAIAGALLAGTRLAHGSRFDEGRRARLGLQIALAAGILAKGLEGLVIPGAAFAAATIASGNYRLLHELRRPRGWWLLGALVLPWHVAVAWRHPGFAWDYVVNQHLLFFLDHKVPRDSEGIALTQFWLAFAIRLFPWTLLLPAAVVRMWSTEGDARARWTNGLMCGWLAAVLLFSITPSRLEHYSIPALPACALAIGRWLAGPPRRAVVLSHLVPLAVAGVLAPFALPALVAGQAWLTAVKGLPELARIAGLMLAVGSLSALALSAWPRWAAVPLVAMMCAIVPVMQHGLNALAPFNSSAPLAAVINSLAGDGDTLVYEAPAEYQSGAGLCFYTQRKWLMLRPDGFVSPPYLAPHEAELFIGREELERRWQSEQVYLVSDPLAPTRASMKGFAPEPFWIIAHSNNRWIVSNARP